MTGFGRNHVTNELFGQDSDTGTHGVFSDLHPRDPGIASILHDEHSRPYLEAAESVYRDLSPWVEGGSVEVKIAPSEDGLGYSVSIMPRSIATRALVTRKNLSSMALRAGRPGGVRHAYVDAPFFEGNPGIIHFRSTPLSWMDSISLIEFEW